MNKIKIDYYKPESKTIRLDATNLSQMDINTLQILIKENQELKKKFEEINNRRKK